MLLRGADRMYWVYVLLNRQADKRYTGQTMDLERRISEHNGSRGNAHRFTAKYPGRWELIHSEQYPFRSAAMKRERWLKSGAGRAWLDEKFGKASPPQAD
jgi:putative endonuclease